MRVRRRLSLVIMLATALCGSLGLSQMMTPGVGSQPSLPPPNQPCPSAPLSSAGPDLGPLLAELTPDLSAELQLWGSGPQTIAGPAAFNCAKILFLADGGENLVLAGPSDACYAAIDADCIATGADRPKPASERAVIVFSPGGAGVNAAIACPYFASLRARIQGQFGGLTCAPPDGEEIEPLDDNAVALYDGPAGAGGAAAAKVVLLSDGGAAAEATCILPPDKWDLCLPILGSFIAVFGQRFDPAAASAAAGLADLPRFGTGTVGRGCYRRTTSPARKLEQAASGRSELYYDKTAKMRWR